MRMPKWPARQIERCCGCIGGPAATGALLAAEPGMPAVLCPRLAGALLRGAESLRAAGDTGRAAALLEKLTAADRPRAVRIAAMIALAGVRGERSAEMALTALAGEDAVMQAAAIRMLYNHPSDAVLAQVVAKFPSLSPPTQAQSLALFAQRGYAGAVPVVADALASSNPGVQQAAVAAAGSIGNACVVMKLAGLVENGSEELQTLVRKSLARIPSKKADEVMIANLATAKPAVVRELIRRCAARRRSAAAVPALLAAARSGDASVRREALSALGKLADAREGLQVLAFLDKTSDAGAIQVAVAAIYARRRTRAGGGRDAAGDRAEAGRAGGDRRRDRRREVACAIRGSSKSNDAEVRWLPSRACRLARRRGPG